MRGLFLWLPDDTRLCEDAGLKQSDMLSLKLPRKTIRWIGDSFCFTICVHSLYYRDLIELIKGRFPHIKFYLHSHGQIMDLVPDLIECGVDILNPVLPLDNMDPVRLKRKFGKDICFHGGIDIEHIVPFGTVEEVRNHVKEVIDILGPGGGYWFKLQAISPVIPPENVITAYELALEHGRYDL